MLMLMEKEPALLHDVHGGIEGCRQSTCTHVCHVHSVWLIIHCVPVMFKGTGFGIA